MTTVVNLSMIEQIIRQKHFMNLKNKYFFKLVDNWETNRYDADDDTDDEEEEERLRKRRKTESHAHQDKIIAWYKENGLESRLLR